MTWRRLRPGELDHEALWLGVSLAALAFAWLWLRTGLPSPACPFHTLTGWACPGCGATRCVRYALHGAWRAAFLINPLMFSVGVGIALFDLYALLVVVARLPRWRADRLPASLAWPLRSAAGAAILLNWFWLIRAGV